MRRCDLIAAVIGVAAATVHADPAADAAYEEGRRLYDLREWDQAIAKFKESYRLSPEPKSLFNIAQAFRLKGDCVEAINFYRTYKRNFPKEKNIGKVDKFITELEPCARQGGKPADAAKPEPKPDPKPDPKKDPKTEPKKLDTRPTEPKRLELESNPQPPPDAKTVASSEPLAPPSATPADTPTDGGKTKRTIGIAVAGAGSVAFAVGIYFGLKARSLAADVEAGRGEWTPELAQTEQDGFSADHNAKVFMGVGAAALVTGGILYVVGRRDRESPPANVSIVPRTGGGLVVWSGSL
ncbi:MAG TPA: hypothetical protein VFQ53_24640 [Kofleriaceae bacterium]|nr:hypothetical protein [Kofleriaceae bacterium]